MMRFGELYIIVSFLLVMCGHLLKLIIVVCDRGFSK